MNQKEKVRCGAYLIANWRGKLRWSHRIRPTDFSWFVFASVRIATNVNRSNTIYRGANVDLETKSLCIENARVVYRLNNTYSVYWYSLNVDLYNEKSKMHQRVDEILLICCHNDYYFITLCMFARGWLEDSWYKEYSWTRTHTTCKAVVQRGRTVRSITIGCCPRRLRSARRLAVWKPLDLAQTERRPADRRISINLVWYRNVGPLRDGFVHPSVFCLLPAAIADAAGDADFMLHRIWFISSGCKPPTFHVSNFPLSYIISILFNFQQI